MFLYQNWSNRLISALIILLFLFSWSCQKKPDLPGFDQETWRKDIRSCQNIRPGLIKGFDQIRPQLKGLGHTQIIEVFGKPEGESLEASGMRVYYYYIQPGAQCDGKTNATNAARIAIRFDALDRVNEVMFINP